MQALIRRCAVIRNFILHDLGIMRKRYTAVDLSYLFVRSCPFCHFCDIHENNVSQIDILPLVAARSTLQLNGVCLSAVRGVIFVIPYFDNFMTGLLQLIFQTLIELCVGVADKLKRLVCFVSMAALIKAVIALFIVFSAFCITIILFQIVGIGRPDPYLRLSFTVACLYPFA